MSIVSSPVRILALAAAVVAAAGLTAGGARASTPPPAAPVSHHHAPARQVNAARLAVAFQPNDGQAAPGVRYLGQASGVTMLFTASGVTLDLTRGTGGHAAAHARVTLAFRHASSRPQITGTGREPGTFNYFLGDNPAGWHTGIPAYAQVSYRGLWPGVTATFTARGGVLRYWFTLAPGASSNPIRLAYTGARNLRITRSGALAITTAAGVLYDQAPATTQATAGHQAPLRSRYQLHGGTSFGFTLARRSPAAAATIDPGLDYSTYLGGSCNQSIGNIASDAAGDLYVFGQTCSADFPTSPGAYQTTLAAGSNAFFVTKFNPAGTAVLYSTFVGDDVSGEWGVVDRSGDVYVAGAVGSANFPTTSGAYQASPDPILAEQNGGEVGVAFKLTPDGSHLAYSTYLPFVPAGGFGADIGLAPGRQVIVSGNTYSDMTPTTPGAFQTAYPGGNVAGYVARLNAGGSGLVYATYLAAPVTSQILTETGDNSCFSSGVALAVDAQGAAYLTGVCTTDFPTTAGSYQADGTDSTDGLLVKLNPAGTALNYATYYGTPTEACPSCVGSIVRPDAVAVDSSGDAYIAADMPAGAGPVTPGALQTDCAPTGGEGVGYYCTGVAEFNPAGTGLVYATYFGGNNGASNFDNPEGIAVGSNGDAYITGGAGNQDIPTTPGSYSPAPGDFANPYYLAVFGKGDLLYATYFGGTGSSVCIGAFCGFLTGEMTIAPNVSGRNVYLGGFTAADNFPVTPGAFQTTNKANGGLGQTAFAAELTLPSLSAAVRHGGYKPTARHLARTGRSRTRTKSALALGPWPSISAPGV
jgi:hypothetical protein